MNILQMGREELHHLRYGALNRTLSSREILHIATTLEAYWQYDYGAVSMGRLGYHAELNSGLHSDGYISVELFLQHGGIREIIARQMAGQLQDRRVRCSHIAGISDGATEFAGNVARYLHVPTVTMKKVDGKIRFVSRVPEKATVLFIDDVGTRGSRFTEAVLEAQKEFLHARVARFYPIVTNRGALETLRVEGVGDFEVISVAEYEMQTWVPEKCPLCMLGSKPIKPKATVENWRLLTTSQLR